MAGQIDVRINIDKGLARMGRLPDDILQELKTTARAQATMLRSLARGRANGDVLQVRTGKFVRSIRTSVRTTRAGVTGKLYSSSPLANIFEYGDAHIPPHEIAPKTARALVIRTQGGMFGVTGSFAAHAMDPGGTIKQRSVIYKTFGEEKGEIEQAMRDAVVDGVRKNQASAAV